MGKRDITKNFRVDDEFETWLGRQLVELDCSLSDLIRTSILLAIGQLKENPSLLRMISLEQMRSQQDFRKTRGNESP
jgi:hypothetical protein